MNAGALLGGGHAQGFRAELARAAASPCSTVLVRAERGAPLDAVLEALHRGSVRSAFPYVTLRCAALADARAELADALLSAQRGTLVLDDVSALPPDAQAFLARTLANRTLDGRPVEARVVAAVAQDPDELAAAGALREDLLYRLNGLSLGIPPLRERPGEVVALARARLAALAPRRRSPEHGFTRAAEQLLARHSRPGNERELELVVECALLRAGAAPIDVAHLALGAAAPVAPAPAGDAAALPLGDRSWSGVEEALIRRVLSEQGGNKSRCARVLGLHRATLHAKLKSYSIGG